MPTRDLTLAVVGSGGDGVITMGDLIVQAGARVGLQVIKVEAYGPQIRGGESSCNVRLSADVIYTQGDCFDILVAFNWGDYAKFKGELCARPDSFILYESGDKTEVTEEFVGTKDRERWIPVPFAQLAKETAGTVLAKNIVALGVLAGLFGLPKEPLRNGVAKRFESKGKIGRAHV